LNELNYFIKLNSSFFSCLWEKSVFQKIKTTWKGILNFRSFLDCTHIRAIARGGERTFHHLPVFTILIFYRTFKDSYAKSIHVTCMYSCDTYDSRDMYYSDDIEKVEGGSNTAVTFKVFTYVRMHNVTRTLMIQERFQSTVYDMYTVHIHIFHIHIFIFLYSYDFLRLLQLRIF